MPHDEALPDGLIQMQQALAGMASESEKDSRVADAAARRLRLVEAMLEAVPVGVVVADPNGRILHGNSHVERMLRHPVLYSDDAESYGEWVAFHEDGRRVESHEFPLAAVLRDGREASELDVHYQRGDGTRFWLRLLARPVLGDDDEVLGATVALIDIDEERRLRTAQQVLIAELNHRVKNVFSVVKSIVSRSLRKVGVAPGLRQTLDRRLEAYAKAHGTLVGNEWDRATLGDVARDVLLPIGGDRVSIEGDIVWLPSRQALSFAMAFYELATNAVKYGALSTPEGRVALRWDRAEPDHLAIQWTETGGPPPAEPTEKGFGSFITNRALRMETTGTIVSTYPPTGLQWRLDMPLAPVDPPPDEK